MRLIKQTSVLLLVVAIVSVASCRSGEQRARIAELQALAQEIPRFPDFKQVHYEDISKSGIAVVTYYYQSSSNFDQVTQFYAKELPARGWTLAQQEGWWSEKGSPITFRKGKYEIVITRDSIMKWQYTVDFSWRS